jgi:hypothetical protein
VVRSAAIALLIICGLTAPAVAIGAPYEPNETEEQAFGPLAGGQTYAAALETAVDDDWFSFYVLGRRKMDVPLTNTTSDASCAIQAEINTEEGDTWHLAVLHKDEVTHFRWTTPSGASEFYLRVLRFAGASGPCAYGSGNTYSFRIDPSNALTTKRCFVATGKRRQAGRVVRRLRRRLVHAKSVTARRNCAQRLRQAERRLRAAGRKAAANC